MSQAPFTPNYNIEGGTINTNIVDALRQSRVADNSLGAPQIVTASTTLTRTSGLVICNNTSAITLTLPLAASEPGQFLTIKQINANPGLVTIAPAGSDTLEGNATAQYLVNQYDELRFTADGVNTDWHILINYAQGAFRRLSRTLVLLTSATTTTLLTVPAGVGNCYVDDLILEGQTTMSGGTSSTLKVGTATNSYVELLNNSTGIVFTAATATSLLAVGARARGTVLKSPASVSVANVGVFAGGSVIAASVSGTVLVAGKVYVELWGYYT